MPARTNSVDAFFRDFGRWIHAPRLDIQTEMRFRIANIVHDAEERGIAIGEARARFHGGAKLCVADQKVLDRYTASVWDCAGCGQRRDNNPGGEACPKCGGTAWIRIAASGLSQRDVTGVDKPRMVRVGKVAKDRVAKFMASLEEAGEPNE